MCLRLVNASTWNNLEQANGLKKPSIVCVCVWARVRGKFDSRFGVDVSCLYRDRVMCCAGFLSTVGYGSGSTDDSIIFITPFIVSSVVVCYNVILPADIWGSIACVSDAEEEDFPPVRFSILIFNTHIHE